MTSAHSDEPENPAVLRIRYARHRLVSLGLISRSSLVFGFLVAMAADLTLLHSGDWQVPLTAVQSCLLVLALLSGLRSGGSEQRAASRDERVRIWLYLAASTLLALLALFEKWWIVLEVEVATRPSYAGSYRVMGSTLTLAGLLLTLGRNKRLARFFLAFAEQPARQAAFSFLALAVFGAFLLTLPFCVRDPSRVSFLNALFMATSAVCVTGLAVHEVAVTYTWTGQAVLLALVQVGGIGIMVLSASFIVLTGRRLKARSSVALVEVLDADSVASLRGSIRGIIGFTLAIEAVGAVLLFIAFSRHPQVAMDAGASHPMAGSGSLWWAALFHAVSAFCNAGFALMHGGLTPFVSSHWVCAVVMALIVLGGLGFPVLSEVSTWLVQRARQKRPLRLSLHTRTVLLMTLALIPGVALLLGSIEWQASLRGLGWDERLLASLFQSVTLRTAGFNTVEFSQLRDAGLMVCILFMLVGGAPGGAAGGLKVTTFAVLFATLRGEMRNAEPHLLDRRLPATTIRRAIAVSFVSAFVLTLSVLSLLLVENEPAIRLAFEAVSAFATVGLSTGITPELSAVGKLVIIVTMLIGRVGPLTVALATAERGERAHHQRPRERVLIG